MSKSTKEISYHCINDCEQTGCPGHSLELIHSKTSDTVEIRIDGHYRAIFDENAFIAIMEAWNEMD